MHPLRCSCHLFPISYFAPHIPPGKTKTNWIWTKLAPIYIFFYRLGLPREKRRKVVGKNCCQDQRIPSNCCQDWKKRRKARGWKIVFPAKRAPPVKTWSPWPVSIGSWFSAQFNCLQLKKQWRLQKQKQEKQEKEQGGFVLSLNSNYRPTPTTSYFGQWHTTRSGDGTELKKENREKQQYLKKGRGNTNLKKELSWRKQIGGLTTIVLIIIIIIIITAITTNIITIMMTIIIMMSMITMTIMIRISKNAPTVSCS